jgi:AcrR family transcriptional regulator
MRRRLLDATVASLSEGGYRGTTTLEVQERAGVSRGALLHHFGSRAELILAAVDHLARERIALLVDIAKAPPPREQRTEWAVEILWSTFEGPLFAASLELWQAARADGDLLAALLPQERFLGKTIPGIAAELFGPETSSAGGFSDALAVLLDSMRGAAARGVLRSALNEKRMLTLWSRMMTSSAMASFA